MSEERKTRSHETIVEIAAPADAVWRGITEASEIVRWFAPQADVSPGEGGRITLSWGPGMEGSSRITVWEPGRHLRLVEERPNGPRNCEAGGVVQAVDDSKPVEVVLDYYLEAKGGSTVLRLVHSGFGATSDWDGEFESTRYGWMMFLRNLRHAITRHPGTPCRQAMLMATSALEPAATWARLMSPACFLASGTADGLQEGDRLEWRAANGDPISGVVTMSFPPKYIGATFEQANDGLFGITVEGSMVMLSLMFYGLEDAEAAAIEARWTELVKSAVAAAAAV
jgi:uncharacterized protein YndB with AHSA1/START domain